MISPVTIYVPVPAGVAGRPGAASRPAAEAGARRPDPIRPVERIAPGDRHGQGGTKFRAVLDDRAAEELASRRRVRPRSQDDPDDVKFEGGKFEGGKFEGGNFEAGGIEAGAAGPAGARGLDRAAANDSGHSVTEAYRAPAPSRALTASLDGPNRPQAIDAVYRTIESFGGDIAERGAIFDFSV